MIKDINSIIITTLENWFSKDFKKQIIETNLQLDKTVDEIVINKNSLKVYFSKSNLTNKEYNKLQMET